jgi:hypothetical protein
MAAAQQAVGQAAAAVASLQQALDYMALPPVDDNNASSSSRGAAAAAAGEAADGAAAVDDAAVVRLKVMAQVTGACLEHVARQVAVISCLPRCVLQEAAKQGAWAVL